MIWTLDEHGPSPQRLLDESGDCIAKVYLTDQATHLRTPVAKIKARMLMTAPQVAASLLTLAMLALQSDRYTQDAEYRRAVDDAITLLEPFRPVL